MERGEAREMLYLGSGMEERWLLRWPAGGGAKGGRVAVDVEVRAGRAIYSQRRERMSTQGRG